MILVFISRILFFFSVMASYLCLLSLNHLLGMVGFKKSKSIAIKLTQYFARLILWNFNIQVETSIPMRVTPAVYVSNHLSYLDAVAIFAHIEAVFITSTEIRDTPGLGHICKMANCLFVNRQRIWGLKEEIGEMQNVLKQGYSIAMFPEGTTSAGHNLHAFKSSLLEAASATSTPIIPLVINYTKFNGRTPMLEDRDYYCWYGSMDFLPHMIRLCSIRSLTIKISQAEVLPMRGLKGERKTATQHSKKLIESNFNPVSFNYGTGC